MQAIEVSWLWWLAATIGIAIAMAIALYYGFYQPSKPDQPPLRGKQDAEEWPGGITEEARGVPTIVWLLVIGTFLYLIVQFALVLIKRLEF